MKVNHSPESEYRWYMNIIAVTLTSVRKALLFLRNGSDGEDFVLVIQELDAECPMQTEYSNTS